MNAAVMQYKVAEITARRVMPGVMALLLVVAGEAAAQAYRPASLEQFDAFGEQRAGRFSTLERSTGWRLYGRFGLLNFQDELDPNGSGVQVSWRRTGPALGAKIYVGIHRRF